jgi:molybdate transport system regulatory protein
MAAPYAPGLPEPSAPAANKPEMPPPRPTVRIRIVVAPGAAIGPGKADLLAGIETHGSIAAAGRAMGMSYQRAWSLIDELNRMFGKPLVSVSRGGSTRGGATLTDTGKTLLARYRSIEAATANLCKKELAEIQQLATGLQESDISRHR